MYPLVPFHALPRLHELVKTIFLLRTPRYGRLREMIPAFVRQLRDEDYFIERALRDARPYRAARACRPWSVAVSLRGAQSVRVEGEMMSREAAPATSKERTILAQHPLVLLVNDRRRAVDLSDVARETGFSTATWSGAQQPLRVRGGRERSSSMRAAARYTSEASAFAIPSGALRGSLEFILLKLEHVHSRASWQLEPRPLARSCRSANHAIEGSIPIARAGPGQVPGRERRRDHSLDIQRSRSDPGLSEAGQVSPWPPTSCTSRASPTLESTTGPPAARRLSPRTLSRASDRRKVPLCGSCRIAA